MKKTIRHLASLALVILLSFSMAVSAFAGSYEEIYQIADSGSADEFMEEFSWLAEPKGLDYAWLQEHYQQHMAANAADPSEALARWGYPSLDELDADIADGWWESREAFYANVSYFQTLDDVETYKPPLSVQFDGERVQFPDAQPQITDARTMVPFRAAAETMGFTVDWNDGQIKASKDGQSIEFFIGQTEYLITDAQGESRGQMDTVPYIRQNRTYVPVRFFAEAFGLTVLWDEELNQAVIFDAEALAAEVDRDFTILNKWLQAQKPADRNSAMKADETMTMTVTVFDSLNGNSVYDLKSVCTGLMAGQGVEIHETADLKELLDLAIDQAKASPYNTEEDIKRIEDEIRDAIPKGVDLSRITLDLLYDPSEDTIYVRCPLLAEVLIAAREDTEDLSVQFKDTWFKYSGLMKDLEELAGRMEDIREVPTIGTILVMSSQAADQDSAADMVSTIREEARVLSLLLGDEQMAPVKGGYKARIDGEKLAAAMDMDPEYLGLSKCDLELIFNTNTGAVSMKGAFSDDTSMSVRFDAEATQTRGLLTMEFHVKNAFKVEMDYKITMKDTQTAPAVKPAENAPVFDINRIMEEDYAEGDVDFSQLIPDL